MCVFLKLVFYGFLYSCFLGLLGNFFFYVEDSVMSLKIFCIGGYFNMGIFIKKLEFICFFLDFIFLY